MFGEWANEWIEYVEYDYNTKWDVPEKQPIQLGLA